jgi:hypothetical protein
MKYIIIFFVIPFLPLLSFSQVNKENKKSDKDTINFQLLEEVEIYSAMIFLNKIEAVKYSKLVRDVKRAYPFAKVAALKMNEYNAIVNNAKTKKEKKKLMKKAEDDLKSQFEKDVKNLTDVQGNILVKLIDRETGSSSYDIIKEFRGSLMATMWQSVGVLFGYNLKSTYNPKGEDKEIEDIVRKIEKGEL